MKRIMLAAVAGSTLAAGALAQPVSLTVDPDLSSLTINGRLATPIGADTDSDTSSVSGTIELDLDDADDPQTVRLLDMILVLDDGLELNFRYGFLGAVDIMITDALYRYATPGTPSLPGSVGGDGDFVIPDVPGEFEGDVDVSGQIIGIPISDSGSLADFGVIVTPIEGSITVADGVVTVFASIEIEEVDIEVEDGVTLTLSGSGTLVATGPVPDPPCIPDFAPPFGVLDIFDVIEFLSLFEAADPAADLAPPFGTFDIFDVIEFLTLFEQGCP